MTRKEMNNNMMASSARNRYLHLRTLTHSSMEALPAELMIDILSRLPVKTIICCKRVCKKWRNLVSDSSFVDLHLSRSPTGLIIHHHPRMNRTDEWSVSKDPGILKWVEIEDKVDHHRLHHDHPMSLDLGSLAPVLQNSRMRQVGSVNGLICLWEYGYKADNTYICNPVTKEYMILPRQCFRKDGFVEVVYGFGVNSLTGEYKVVRVSLVEILPNAKKPSWSSVSEAKVYTLGTGQWRSLGPVPYRLNAFQEFYVPFLNNHCHWIVSHKENAQESICAFDFDKETFQLFPSPPPAKENWYHHQRLGILKGCLCKLEIYNFELTIWVMMEYGINNSWQKEVVIRREICFIQWPLYEPIQLIAGLKDGSILMVFENKLCVYDPRRETIEDTKMFDRDLSGRAYRPSFLKLQNFESEMVHMF